MKRLRIRIDGREIETKEGKSILEAALDSGIYIPHLCYHPDLSAQGDCGLCIVEIDGFSDFQVSCIVKADEGMVVKTKSERLTTARKEAMKKILEGHPVDCTGCPKYLNCELLSLKQFLDLSEAEIISTKQRVFPINDQNPLFIHDPTRCVLCKRCVRACKELRGVGILSVKEKDGQRFVYTESGKPLSESGCMFCGACVEVCPTGALRDKEELLRGKKKKEALIPCNYHCPAGIDIPSYVRLIRIGNYKGAMELITQRAPLPEVLGYVCPAPCESVCRRSYIDEPVAIRTLKRFLADNYEGGLYEIKKKTEEKKIAIVGSGPAGLTAAFFLRKKGYKVTVFEAQPVPGGMMRLGIPEYRLPREVLQREIDRILKMGIELKVESPVKSLRKLFQEGFDAIIVAIGAQKPTIPPIPGIEFDGIYAGIEFLKRVNLGEELKLGDEVVVIGGGSVAIDCGRMALRKGAKNVRLICIEKKNEMPAIKEEIKEAELEGIRIEDRKNVAEIRFENGLFRLICMEVLSFSFDEKGKLTIKADENSIKTFEAKNIIFATGQLPDFPETFEIKESEKGLIKINPRTMETEIEGIFAAGDAVTGTRSVVEAINSGRKAAENVDRYLGGDGIFEEIFEFPDRWQFKGKVEGFVDLQRLKKAQIVEEEAIRESKRCLECDLRFKIRPVKFWAEY